MSEEGVLLEDSNENIMVQYENLGHTAVLLAVNGQKYTFYYLVWHVILVSGQCYFTLLFVSDQSYRLLNIMDFHRPYISHTFDQSSPISILGFDATLKIQRISNPVYCLEGYSKRVTLHPSQYNESKLRSLKCGYLRKFNVDNNDKRPYKEGRSKCS